MGKLCEGVSRLSLPVILTASAVYTPVPPDTTVVKVDKYILRQIESGAMNGDLTPNFRDSTGVGNESCRSVFGPFFPIPKLCLPGKGPVEYRILVGRMIALRAPDKPGYSVQLAHNQVAGIRSVRCLLGLFKRHLELNIDRKSYEESYPAWLYEPNAKRLLRIRTHELANGMGGNHQDDLKHVEFKPKNDELLAANKKRGIGDLGVYRTDATAHIMGSIKEAWKVDFVHHNYTIRYVKSADKISLSDAFRDLIAPGHNRVVFVYHSDDSCVGASCSDGVVNFNGDISACDGSHRTVLFNTLLRMLSHTHGVPNVHHSALKRAFSYLEKDLVVKYSADRKQKVRYSFNTHRLYSGSTLTTIVNNFANLLIAMALTLRVPNPSLVTMEEFYEQYRLAGEDVGYILRTGRCSCPEQLQFLKHSPTLIGDVWVPWMNLGAYIRGFGSFAGYLPHKTGKYREAAAEFVSEVVRGRLGWGNHLFNDAFHHLMGKEVTLKPRIIRVIEEEKSKSLGVMGERVSLCALARRYECTVVELEELCYRISTAGVSDVVYLPIVERIYATDYG